MKVAISRSFGNFGLPDDVWNEYKAAKKLVNEPVPILPFCYDNNFRSDPILIGILENTGASDIDIIEIPDDVGMNWHICEYDGLEWIAEDHRTWDSMTNINTTGGEKSSPSASGVRHED